MRLSRRGMQARIASGIPRIAGLALQKAPCKPVELPKKEVAVLFAVCFGRAGGGACGSRSDVARRPCSWCRGIRPPGRAICDSQCSGSRVRAGAGLCVMRWQVPVRAWIWLGCVSAGGLGACHLQRRIKSSSSASASASNTHVVVVVVVVGLRAALSLFATSREKERPGWGAVQRLHAA